MMRSIRSFKHILSRFLEGLSPSKEKEVVEKWYERLDAENNHARLDAAQAEEMHRRDFERIQKRMRQSGLSRTLILWPSLAAAAIALLVIFNFYNRADRNNSIALVQPKAQILFVLPNSSYRNSATHQQEIWLTDSSRIVLEPYASISVGKSFNGRERSVEMSGQAFFNIRRNERKPFTVLTHGVVTSVLGTSFSITAPSKNEQVKVVVKSGRVSVSTRSSLRGVNHKSDEVVLTRNQQVIFNPAKQSLQPSLASDPVLLPDSPKPRYEYDDEPVVKILDEMEALYGIDIVYDEHLLAECRITTTLETNDLYKRLRIIALAIGASYEVGELQILFKSNGCKLR